MKLLCPHHILGCSVFVYLSIDLSLKYICSVVLIIHFQSRNVYYTCGVIILHCICPVRLIGFLKVWWEFRGMLDPSRRWWIDQYRVSTRVGEGRGGSVYLIRILPYHIKLISENSWHFWHSSLISSRLFVFIYLKTPELVSSNFSYETLFILNVCIIKQL